MKNLQNNSFLNLENEIELPQGKKIVNKSGLWVIHQDLRQISFYNSISPHRVFVIDELELKTPNDDIKTIDFIEQNQIYVFAVRNKIPTGFFIKIDREDETESDNNYFQDDDSGFKMPNTLSFALDSLYFHRQILASFTPVMGAFCIVSEEGMTLHDINFEVYFSLIHQIRFCLYSGNFLYATDGIKYTIYQFEQKLYEYTEENISTSNISLNIYNEENENKIFKKYYDATPTSPEALTANGYPCAFISLSSCLLIILKNPEKQSFQVQIHNLYQNESIHRVFHDISNEVRANKDNNYAGPNTNFENYIPYFHFLEFDDCLLSVDASSPGSLNLLDFNENQYTPVGGQFRLQNDLHIIGIFNHDFALCDNNCIYKINTDYSKIKTDSLEVIAAIMRRRDGPNNAFDRIREKLKTTYNFNELKKIVNKIGPSATDSIAQMKFARLIQFSGISDPHLIILGLIQFSFVLGDDMIDETWIPFLEVFSHSQIENLLDSAIKNGIIKLNPETIKNLTLAFSRKIHIDENIYSVENLIDYANAYIDMGIYDDAKLIITLAQLSGLYQSEQIDPVKERLNHINQSKENPKKNV